MWYDCDIDTVMNRTHNRPLATGEISRSSALRLGLALTGIGLGLAIFIDILYGMVVLAGVVFDVIIYTIWLKRRTPWSIVWGGFAGGMPILAGRTLAIGQIDLIGLLLAMAVLFWIPTHILTFAMRYHQDYLAVKVPTIPAIYGFESSRALIALSAITAAASIGVASVMIGVQAGMLRLLVVLSCGLLLLSWASIFRPSELVNYSLFKYASIYMLSAMLLLAF
jgi:protoheme IX farnesyltransferase